MLFIVAPKILRIDRGTETDDMGALHFHLRRVVDPRVDRNKCVRHGTSTQNKIERFWVEIVKRFHGCYKTILRNLKESGEYDENDSMHKYVSEFHSY